MKDLVSVIIPTYKTNNSLIRAIESVLNQTYHNIEIIVVDDNDVNSDYRKNAEKIMGTYLNNKKIRYIQHEFNKNGATARNTGIKNSKGSYICFLDDDDYFFDNKIELQLNFLEKFNVDLVSCYYYKDNNLITFKNKKEYINDIFLGKYVPQTSSFFIKTICLKELNGFDETYFRHQDYEFLLRFFDKGKSIGIIEKPLYVMDSNGVTNVPNGDKMYILKNKFLSQFEYLIEKNNLNRKKIYAYNYSIVLFAYLKQRKLKEFFYVLKKNFSIFLCLYFFSRCFKAVKYKIVKSW